MNRRPCACAVGSSRIDAHALAARQFAEFRQHDVERAIDFAGGQQRAIDFAEHLEGAPVALQVTCEVALNSRSSGVNSSTALRGRFRSGVRAGARVRAAAPASAAGNARLMIAATAKAMSDGERQQAERRGHQLRCRRAECRLGREHHDGVGGSRIAGRARAAGRSWRRAIRGPPHTRRGWSCRPAHRRHVARGARTTAPVRREPGCC